MNNHLLHTDQELFQLLRNSEREAFAELYRRYHGGLYNYLLKFTHIPALAEDLLQDVFIKIWDQRGQIEIKNSFSGYLYRMARNASIDYLNQVTLRNQLLRLQYQETGNMEMPVDTVYEWRHYQQLLATAIDGLSERRREVFILCRQEGKTYEETATELGISRHTVKEYLSDAVKGIRDYLLKHGDTALVLLLMSFFV